MTQAMLQRAQGGVLLAQISTAMVRAMRDYYGKGPTKAKTYMFDDYVFVVMEGGVTRVEETLLRSGKDHLVREVRQTFQNEMAEEFSATIENMTGRKVIGYQSQIIFAPDTSFEIFLLEPLPPADPPAAVSGGEQEPPAGVNGARATTEAEANGWVSDEPGLLRRT